MIFCGLNFCVTVKTAKIMSVKILYKYGITNLIFLSLFTKKRPRILMAKTRRPLSLLMSIMVSTVS